MSVLRLTPEQLRAYNAKRGGWAPTEIDITTVADLAAGRGPQYARGLLRDFTCTIPGVPVAKGRPRLGKHGTTYTPEKTRAAERKAAAAVSGAVPMQGPVSVEIDFFLPVPSRFNRKQTQQALQGEIRPTAKPDVDNLAKLVLDAIQGHGPGHAFVSDAQVVELVLRKWYAEEPRTVLQVREL